MTQTLVEPSQGSDGAEEILLALRRILPERTNAAEVFATVMRSFSRRLTKGEALHLLSDLDPEVRKYFADAVIHRTEAASSFDRETFMKKLSFTLDLPREKTEEVVFKIFSLIEARLSPTVEKHVAAQLPADLELLWREAAGASNAA